MTAAIGLTTAAWSSSAEAASPACARTAQAGGPSAPTAGRSCWVDTTPYPFGADGNPVDTSSANCSPALEQSASACYLAVTSLAFRAWNRGLAAVSKLDPTAGNNPYGVWLYNGARWFPDPTFPGSAICKGTRILWAGKLDYWLIGGVASSSPWPALCRFDGTSYQWEPLAIPKATLAQIPTQPSGSPDPGTITSGSCFAWNDCWFFGTFGVVLHWDGQTLQNESQGLGMSPWLEADYTDAATGTDAATNPFAIAAAATTSGFFSSGPPPANVPPQPDGTAAPQLFSSTGGSFRPLSFSTASAFQPSVTSATDIDAIDFAAGGEGWIAGNPAGIRPGGPRFATAVQPAPLAPISPSGQVTLCPGTPADSFTAPDYSWATVGALPSGDAIAGGWETYAEGGPQRTYEPVLAQVSCQHAPATTVFRVPEPGAGNPGTAPLVPGDRNGYVSALAASAVNDVWAATTSGSTAASFPEPPHLYLLTDGQPPLAPAGDDNESRPLVLSTDPTLFVIAPPVIVPLPPAPTISQQTQQTKVKRVKVKAAIYAIAKPRLVRRGRSFMLELTFKVRRRVTIELEALHGHKLVASTGFKTFSGTRGLLVLRLDPKRWPTRLKFVLPPVKKAP